MRPILLIALLPMISACSTMMNSDLDREFSAGKYSNLEDNIRIRAEACQASEQDLLPQSVKAITQHQAQRILRVFQYIYSKPDMSDNMKAESLYQIGLIHMNEFNRDRDDHQAVVHLNRLKVEFPSSALCSEVDARLKIIEQRQTNIVVYDSKKLNEFRDAVTERANACNAEEPALIPESIEAIGYKQAHQAISVFLDMSKDPALPNIEKEQALYQIGLIYMNTVNVHRDDRSALHYFKQLLQKFPHSAFCGDAQMHIETLKDRLNR